MPTYVEILDAEIASESPVTVSLMTRLRDNALAYLGAAAGTVLVAYQATAPLGWIKRTDHHDKALRVVNDAAGGSAGGTLAFSTVFAKTATDNFTLGETHLPAYFLNLASLSASGSITFGSANLYTNTAQSGAGRTVATTQSENTSSSLSILQSASVAVSIGGNLHSGGSGSAHAHPMDIRVQYCNTILIQKS